MAFPQHRCVFVGNIPYDATEEQLIEICREVGPVVSFRQLRVDFAENDKGSDRDREQGRGGPGLATNIDPQKQVGGQAVQGESFHLQPIGLHSAITAAALVAEALGGVRSNLQHNQNALPGQSAPATDPLTLHLAKMSRSQLNEIMSELKKIATQNKERARELLLSKPQLLKAIFQAQVMLGMFTPQMLKMPNIRQPLGQHAQTPLQDAQHSQQPTSQALFQMVQTDLIPKVQSQISSVSHNSLARNQFSATLQSTLQPRTQLLQHSSNHVLPPAAAHSLVPKLPSINAYVRPQIPMENSSSLNQQLHLSLPHSRQLATANLSHGGQVVLPNAVMKSAPAPHPSVSDTSFQPGPSRTPGIAEKSNIVWNPSEAVNRPLEKAKLDGEESSSPSLGLNVSSVSGFKTSQTFGVQHLINKYLEQKRFNMLKSIFSE